MQQRKKDKITELDRLISQNFRDMRIKKKVKIAEISQALQVSHQQVNKYDKGINRISGASLFIIAYILKCNVYDFITNNNISSNSYSNLK